MWLSAVTFLALVSNISAKYGLYFTGDSSLKYDYAIPVDMANNNIRIDFTIPQAFSESLDVSGLPLALLNISSVQLDSLTIEIHPGNYIFITVLAPDSAQDPQAMGYCMYGSPLPNDEILSLEVNRTGNVIEMSVNGEVENVQCIPIAVEPVTGEINQVQYVTIGYSTDTFQLTSFVGCIHAAVIDGVDLLADTCQKATPGKFTTALTFESDACPAVAPTASVVCPTTAPPTTEAKATTKPTTNISTTKPATTLYPPAPTEPKATLPNVETEAETTTDPLTEESKIPMTKEPPVIVKVDTDAPEATPDNVVEPTEYVVVDPDNNLTTDEAVLEKSTSEDNDNSLIIIICVVVGGVIVVVILLTIGYKFHFRDKGSYKLEESKNFDNDGFNEYSDLNAAEKKNEEWYL